VIARLRRLVSPFELYTYSMTAVIVIFLRASNLRMGWKTLEFSIVPMIESLHRPLLIGLVLHLASYALTRRSPLAWLRAVVTPKSILLWLRVWFAAMAMTYGYKWLKVCVPLLRATVFDPALWKIDRVLHFGLSPSVFAAELVQGTPVARWLDVWYSAWVSTVLVALAYIFLSDDLAKRRNFALACALLWLTGAWIYYAFPALGPCFTVPEVFARIRLEMPSSAHGQEALWHNYGLMLAGRDGSLKEFNPYFGVAALPSLHVGAHWLFTLWSRRYARRLVPIFAAATLLTFLGSIATGWHYAIDGYAGMLLAWGAVRLADRFEPVALPPAEDGAASPPVPPPAALSGTTSPLP
jgi:hypothetical protein